MKAWRIGRCPHAGTGRPGACAVRGCRMTSTPAGLEGSAPARPKTPSRRAPPLAGLRQATEEACVGTQPVRLGRLYSLASQEPDYPEQAVTHRSAGILAVRVFYEAELAEKVCRSELSTTRRFRLSNAQDPTIWRTSTHATHTTHTDTVCRRLAPLPSGTEVRPEELQRLSRRRQVVAVLA
jgi:hypothetical protein